MSAATRTSGRTIWAGIVLVILTIFVSLFASRLKRIEAEDSKLPVFSQVEDFQLTNQVGAPISFGNLRGRIWVADIIFSRCAGPCPEMTRNMRELQVALKGDESVRLVSLTTDPDFDTPDVLERYQRRFEADGSGWWFLTGAKGEIFRLAVDGLKLTAIEKDSEDRESVDDLFIHSTLFVVVDRHGRLRSAIQGLESGWKERVLEVVRRLKNEGA